MRLGLCPDYIPGLAANFTAACGRQRAGVRGSRKEFGVIPTVEGIAIRSRLPHVAAFWDNACLKLPNAPACTYAGRTCSFAQMDTFIAGLAGRLRDEAGVERGDRVAIAMPNCGAYLTAYWAALRLGAVVVPVNIKLRAGELAYVLGNAEPKVIFLHEQVADAVTKAAAEAEVSAHVISVASDADGPQVLCPSDTESVARTCPELCGEDIAIILYTSGTTGQPKGAIMRHEDLLFNVHNAILAHSFRHEDVHLLAIPFSAPTATYSLLPSCAYLASEIVIAPQPYPGELFDLIDAHGCTTFIGVPTLFHLVTQDPRLAEADLSSLRLIAYSGSPMPARTITNLRRRFPRVVLHNFFGLTETISMTHVLAGPDAVEKPDSIGKALPEIYTRIVDDADNDVAVGEVGELCFRRDNVIVGYWRREGQLEEAIKDGWFHTGDFASSDEDGYLYVQGRKKDMIIVAGQNVYALEVEKVILRNAEVREVAVIGIEATGARAALGELVKAVVVPQPGANLTELDIKRHCAAQLPSYKVPQVVTFSEELPKNAAGKVLKRELR